MTDMFKGLSKKKKSKKSSKETGDAEEPTADGEFDASALKKKKKKVKKDAGDFEAKLAEAGLDEEGDKEQAEEALPEGDAEAGTGIWAHDATQVIPYPLLVSRFFALVQSHHPDLLASGTKAYKIPPPQCLREGNRRTVFANIAEICARMKRSDEHVTQFLFAELGTSGSVDGSKRLVIKGRYVKPRISTHPSFRPSKGCLVLGFSLLTFSSSTNRFQGKQLESVLRKVSNIQPTLLLRSEILTDFSIVHRRVRHLQDLPQPQHRA